MLATIDETSSDRIAASDQELIRLTLSGDSRGPEGLVERYYSRLYRTILPIAGCTHATEDIVQEAFLNAFRRLDAFQHNCQFYSWLYRIASNVRCSYHRKHARLKLLTTDGDTSEQPMDARDTPSAAIERQEARDTVQNALASMEERYRRILMLREFEQLDYNTIAEILNLQLGTVRSRLHRARSRLRAELRRQI
jgi:RNA polymerase sigma-70 factor (ECF subfamily)